MLSGTTDAVVPYSSTVSIRNAAAAHYGITGNDYDYPAGDPTYSKIVTTKAGAPRLEMLDHAYETVQDGPRASVKGHCIPGSTATPYATDYSIPCKLPNSFDWGAAVLAFFEAHPMP